MVKSKSSLCTIDILKRVSNIYPNEIDMFYSNLHTIGALFDLFQHVKFVDSIDFSENNRIYF